MNSPATDSAAIVPNSSSVALPQLTAPENACDCHLHIFDPAFAPSVADAPTADQGTAADYRRLQRCIGTTRAVIVQAKYYGTDNSCLLDAIEQLGRQNSRGIAVVHPQVSDSELRRLDAGGVHGLRFSIWNPRDTVTTVDMIEPLAKRIHELGWHAQLHMSGDQIIEHEGLLRTLPCPLIFDHMGRLPIAAGVKHPAFAIICRLIAEGRAWVKLSGAYLNTISGPPAYADASAVARAFAAAAPDRVVWGSDWPHVTEKHKPDDSLLFDLLADWIPDAAARKRALVDNPAALYDFN
jgi:predicted TIM-barrel fold metal-dependent hydrolase